MDNLIIHPEDQPLHSLKYLVIKICSDPKAVFKYIQEREVDKYESILLVLGGINACFDRAMLKDMGDKSSIWFILGICVLLGALIGWIGYYVYANMLSWTGKWLSGKTDSQSFVRMLSFAAIPSIFKLFILIPLIVIFGNEIFKSKADFSDVSLLSLILYYGLITINLLLELWTFMLTVVGVSELQGFSYGKGFLNAILPFLIVCLPLFLIFWIVKS